MEYSKLLKKDNLVELQTGRRRFNFLSVNSSDSFYCSSSKIFFESKPIDGHVNEIITDSYNARWGQEYRELLCSVNKERVSRNRCVEYYDEVGTLIGHHMMYLGTVRQLVSVLKNLEITIVPNELIVHGDEKAVVIACSYSASEVIYWFNVIKTIEYCLESQYNAEIVYFKTHNNITKEYLEYLGASVYTYGPVARYGIRHYNKNYKWLGMILPFANVLANHHIYDSILKSLNVSIFKRDSAY